MNGLAHYYFLPSLRQGLASSIEHTEAEGFDATRAFVNLRLRLQAAKISGGHDEADVPTEALREILLYGPGDVLGFDPRVVARTDPKHNVGDFEPNYFPAIEFTEPDFPWRFTAAAQDNQGRLTPWITLIVLVAERVLEGYEGDGTQIFKEREFDEGDQPQDGTLPRILVSAAYLPDLNEAWRWAHVQVTAGAAENGTASELTAELQDIIRTEPERAVSRLVCARRLRPGTLYNAFVVPTYELGRKAGVGRDVGENDNALIMSWNASGNQVIVPYYHRWEFRTGLRGDFEHLVRLLEPRKLTDLGIRDIDCATPGYGLPGIVRTDEDPSHPNALGLEGALLSLDTGFTLWGKDAPDNRGTPFQRRLATELLNRLTTERSLQSGPIPLDQLGVVDNLIMELSPDGTGVTIRWTTDDEVTWTLNYGQTDQYGDTLAGPASGTPATEHSAALGGLTPDLTYHLRITLTYADGSTRSTADITFATPDPSALSTEELAAYGITQVIRPELTAEFSANGETADIRWVTDEEVTWSLEYGVTDQYGTIVEGPETGAPGTIHRAQLSGLQPGTTYHFRISSQDANGNIRTSSSATFITPNPAELPSVGPLIYGRWQASREVVDSTGLSDTWIDVLNLDPRHRVAAGFGTQVIRKLQESLMASAWQQVGAVRRANEILRRAQLARGASVNLFERLKTLATSDFLAATVPVHARVRMQVEQREVTVRSVLNSSPIPGAVFDPAFRRIQRVRGPVRKRQQQDDTPRPSVLDRLNMDAADAMRIEPAGPHPAPDGMISLCDIGRDVAELSPDELPPAEDEQEAPVDPIDPGGPFVPVDPIDPEEPSISFRGGLTGAILSGDRLIDFSDFIVVTPGGEQKVMLPPVCEDSFTCDAILAGLQDSRTFEGGVSALPPGTIPVGDTDTPSDAPSPGGIDFVPIIPISPDRLRTAQIGNAICGALDGWLNKEDDKPKTPPVDLEAIRGVLEQALDPETTIVKRTRQRLDIVAVDERKDPLDGVKACPDFPQPMYEPLRDISQELLVPGIEKIPQNTVGLLKTNRRFLEAYMTGCNQEFSSEMLWREYPADLRCTCFRQFWDVSGYVPTLSDRVVASQRYEDFYEEDEEARQGLIRKYRDRLGDVSLLTEAKLEEQLRAIVLEEYLEEKLKDIKPIVYWGASRLGDNDNNPPGEDAPSQLVLIIRGDLLKRYPNAVIYAVLAQRQRGSDGPRVPALREFLVDADGNYLRDPATDQPVSEAGAPKYPLFSGTLPQDITFIGFDLTPDEACGDGDYDGYYFVIEERVSEARFGMDAPSSADAARPENWDALSWSHMKVGDGSDEALPSDSYVDGRAPVLPTTNVTPSWPTGSRSDMNLNSAQIARITVQKPVRIAVHAHQMMPKGVCGGEAETET